MGWRRELAWPSDHIAATAGGREFPGRRQSKCEARRAAERLDRRYARLEQRASADPGRRLFDQHRFLSALLRARRRPGARLRRAERPRRSGRLSKAPLTRMTSNGPLSRAPAARSPSTTSIAGTTGKRAPGGVRRAGVGFERDHARAQCLENRGAVARAARRRRARVRPARPPPPAASGPGSAAPAGDGRSSRARAGRNRDRRIPHAPARRTLRAASPETPRARSDR